MTVQLGDTGRVLYGTAKTLNISPYVVETTLSPITLPTAISTGSPQVTWTVNTSNMAPTFSGVNIVSYKPVYSFIVGGQNTSGASVTINYQINKNGTSYKTGSASVSNNNYFTSFLLDGSLVNGDIIDFYLWSTGSTNTITYKSCVCLASHVDTGAKSVVNISFTPNTMVSLLTSTGKARDNWNGAVNFYIANDTTNYYAKQSISTFTIPFAQFYNGYRLFTLAGQANTQSSIYQSASYFPWFNGNYHITSITYRDFLR